MSLREQALDAAGRAIERLPVEGWIDRAVEKGEGLDLPWLFEELTKPFLEGLRERKDALADYTREEALDFLERVARGDPADRAVGTRFEDRIAQQQAANRELHADTLARLARRAGLVSFLEEAGKGAVQVGLAILAQVAKDELLAR